MSRLTYNKPETGQVLTRRAFVIGSLQLGLLGVLGGRLAWLQIVEGQKYKTLAEKNRINIKITPPTRGEIIDRYGVPLAVNRPDFRVLVIPEQAEDIANVIDNLQNYVNVPDEQVKKTLEQAKKTAGFIPVEIRGNLSREEVARIEVNLPDLPGIITDTGEKRNYPFTEATAHLIGYVGAVTKDDLAKENIPLLQLPGFRIGKSGLEKKLDSVIRGKPGQDQVEVNVHGREVRKLDQIDSQTGSRVTLTIDAELQNFVQQRLSQERSASAVVIDLHTGAVYAMASSPSFDPNSFVDGISIEQYEELLANPAFPLNYKAIKGQYPPGSTFKIITALALLEAGVATSSTTVHCPGYYEYGRDRFHCWKHGGHGWMNVTSALEQSCDTFFYKLCTDLGIDKIAEMSRRFGLGEKTGIEFDDEASGLVPNRDWKKSRMGTSWQPGETIVASIGQGYLLTTPLQLAIMTARVANNGKAVTPHLIGAVNERKLSYPEPPPMTIDPYHLQIVQAGLVRVMEGSKGTAAYQQIRTKGMEMAGKTGTSQVKRITRAQRAAGIQNKDLPWKDRHHALFVGYAPISNPRYVCSVVVEHGVSGSGAAAPVCRDILKETQVRDPASTEIVI